jgi:FkbM family methyltransferase
MIKPENILPESLYWPIKNYYDAKIKTFYFKSYSQEGEDLILTRILGEKKEGFYIDVGAHHPKRFSNTFLFYKRGWRGINIEARPGSKKLFDKIRPRDINVEVPISSEDKILKYYMFNEPAFNGFSEEMSKSRNGLKDYKIIKEIDLHTKTLKEVLNSKLMEDQHIDFMTIDVEGLDYDVLVSNDWAKYKPSIILIEDVGYDLHNMGKSKVYNYLIGKGYSLTVKIFNTLFFSLKAD